MKTGTCLHWPYVKVIGSNYARCKHCGLMRVAGLVWHTLLQNRRKNSVNRHLWPKL